MITGIIESKTLIRHISCERKYKFDGRKWNSSQKWNDDKCRCECKIPKEHHMCKKDYIWNPGANSCENGKYLPNIIDTSVITCDKIIETTKNSSNKF